MAYIHLYQGSGIASGDTSGVQISENTGISPLIVTLNATSNEVSSPIKLGIRCDSGYKTTGDTVITPTGISYDKWALAPDNSGSAGTFGAYGDPLTITSVIDATNTLFYVKAKATSNETPINDSSTDLVTTATIEAV